MLNKRLIREDVERLEKNLKPELGWFYGGLFPYLFFYKKLTVFSAGGLRAIIGSVYNMNDGSIRAKSHRLYGTKELFGWFDKQEDELYNNNLVETEEQFFTDADIYKLPTNQKEAKEVFTPTIEEDLKPISLETFKYKKSKKEDLCQKKNQV